jgi:hypothetical protein
LGGWNPFAPGSASDTTGLNGVVNSLFGTNTTFGQFINANIWNTIFSSGFYMPGNYAGTAADFMGLQQSAGGAAGGAEGAAGAAGGAAEGAAATATVAATGPLGGLGAVGSPVSAAVGNGAMVGSLSVPASWTVAAPHSAGPSAVGATAMVAPPPAVAAGMPGVPMGGMGGQGYGRNAPPRYGFKPVFVTRPPAAG